MRILKRIAYAVLIGVFSLFFFIAAGCARHPNPEQIQKMEEARSACLAAEQKLQEKQSENQKLEQQLAEKKAQLEDLKKEKELIQQRLSNWSTQE
ncbi:MAG: hypothetical protein Kow0042_09750 [Calditrichia bacterium]